MTNRQTIRADLVCNAYSEWSEGHYTGPVTTCILVTDTKSLDEFEQTAWLQ